MRSTINICLTVLGSTLGLCAQPHAATIHQYCLGCHNSKVKSGGLALDSPGDVAENADVWERVVRKLRARMMPPVGLPRPDEATYKSLIASLETSLDRAAAAHPNPGRTDTFRRLTRTEYHNVIRDLLSLDVDVASLLPSDEVSHGFDNITVGDLPPTLLERYLSSAQKISHLAVGGPVRSPGGDTFQIPPDVTQEEHFEDLPFGTRGGTALQYTFPVDAEYDFQIRLQRDRNEHVEGLKGTHQVELMLDGERVREFTIAPPKGGDHHLVEKDMNVRISVPAGPHMVAVAFPKMPSVLLESGRQPYLAHFNNDRHPRLTPALLWVSVNGPYNAKGPATRRAAGACSFASPRTRHAPDRFSVR